MVSRYIYAMHTVQLPCVVNTDAFILKLPNSILLSSNLVLLIEPNRTAQTLLMFV